MKKLLLASCVAFGLGGCATTNNSVPTIDPATVSAIQQDAQAICGFLPTATTVAQIITTFTGGSGVVNVVAEAAQGICTAITAKGLKRGGAKFRGVRIQGKFVR